MAGTRFEDAEAGRWFERQRDHAVVRGSRRVDVHPGARHDVDDQRYVSSHRERLVAGPRPQGQVGGLGARRGRSIPTPLFSSIVETVVRSW